jgi:hypothetical protein
MPLSATSVWCLIDGQGVVVAAVARRQTFPRTLMLWIYRRNDQELRVEAQVVAGDGHHVIRVVRPDGREQFETLSGDGALCLRLTELESQLREQNWIDSADPILTDDAKLKPSEPAMPERRALTDRRRFTRRDRRSRDLAVVKTAALSPADTRKSEDS